MVMDYSIDIVVVLTTLVYAQGSAYKERCRQYWPDQSFSSKIFNHICITKLGEYNIREDTFKGMFKLNEIFVRKVGRGTIVVVM